MKQEFLVALLVIGFIFAGVTSASAGAVTWTLVEHAAYANSSPVPRMPYDLLCVPDTGPDKCNLDFGYNCKNVGNPLKGSCSYVELHFPMASSCAAGPNTGESCTTNADCGSLFYPCVPCNPGHGQVGIAYLGHNEAAESKGLGKYVVCACANGFTVTSVAIGASEAITNVGGYCTTLNTFNASTGCGEGSVSMDLDLKLWTSLVTPCGSLAGTMPNLALSGRIYAVPTYTTGVCGYTTTEIGNIASTVGLGSGDYLSIMCGNGTLPTDLETACIPGGLWRSVIVASTSSDLSTICPGPCNGCGGGGCMAATAERVE